MTVGEINSKLLLNLKKVKRKPEILNALIEEIETQAESKKVISIEEVYENISTVCNSDVDDGALYMFVTGIVIGFNVSELKD